jgi:hypothetical protein
MGPGFRRGDNGELAMQPIFVAHRIEERVSDTQDAIALNFEFCDPTLLRHKVAK